MRIGSTRTLATCLAILVVCCPWGMPAAADDDTATVMIYRPKRFSGGAAFSSYRVDGQSLGKFKHGVFEVKVDPGLHEIRNFFPASAEAKFDRQNGVMKYSTAVVEVELKPGETVYVLQQSNGVLQVASRGVLGDKFQETPQRTPLVARIEGTIVTPGETTAWEHCSAGNARDCRDYLKRYPYGTFVDDAHAALAEATPAPKPGPAISERTRSLPVAIQRDRHMLSLTSALKEERYLDALVYFVELEKLKVQLSPSFLFYYGEALFHTGDYEGSIDKLYAYIAEAGTGGEHYHRALELSTEAEDR